MAGRQTECTPATTAVIVEAVRNGATYRLACMAAGITTTTFHNWKNKGDDGISPYCEFVEALARAEAEHAAKLVKVLERLAVSDETNEKYDPRVAADASKFLLASRYRKDYGPSQQVEVEHTGAVGIVTVPGIEGMTTEQLLAMRGKRDGG